MGKKKNKENKIVVSFVDSPSSDGVTGSMIYIKSPNHNLLLDVGINQTSDKLHDYLVNNRKTKEFKPKDIDTIIVSHVHGDHLFLAPTLYARGCRATTFISEKSTGTVSKMLDDCAYINERDAIVLSDQESRNYKPLFTPDDKSLFMEYLCECPTNEVIKVDEELSFELIPSGHLLGGCQIMLYFKIGSRYETICYTGDIGNCVVNNRFVGKLEKINKCSLLIAESTYGNRKDLRVTNKERQNDLDKLKTIIDTQILQMKGRVIIPSFAMSRCQQLAYMIYDLYKNDPNFTYKVYIDSPLAINIFKEYAEILEGKDKEDFDNLMNWDKLVFVKESEDSKALVKSHEPCCVISSSGMCNVGRITHHIKANVNNPNATLLFCGYSTDGSLASILKDPKRKKITLDNKEYDIKCASKLLKSMSGHAPFDQLVDYYSSINCNKIVLHHGDLDSKMSLRQELVKEFEKQCKTTQVSISNPSMKITL